LRGGGLNFYIFQFYFKKPGGSRAPFVTLNISLKIP
jgi:hypothetical protein